MRRSLAFGLALILGLAATAASLGGCAKPACCRGHPHICLSCG
ncbi:hypothetical protein [Bosea sp. (in: a-proteobacteria)]